MLDRRRRCSGEPTASVDHVAFGDISRDGLGTDTDMDPSQAPVLGVPEPPEVADLRRLSADIVRLLAERASDRHRGLRPIVGSAAIAQELTRLEPMAAKSIPGFALFEDSWGTRAPLGWDVNDATAVARSCVALLSDWFPATTGEMIHVDGGYHAIGA